MSTPDVDRMVRLETEFRVASGLTDRRFYKIFYSAIAPAPLLVIGFNPGGETDGTDLNASESFYENWEHDYVDFRGYGNAYTLAGRAYDTLTEALQTSSEDDIRRIPATNVIFRRSRRSSGLCLPDRAAAHESAPVLAGILRAVDPEAILVFGSKAFRAFVGEHCVRGSLVVNAEPPQLFARNGTHFACMFRSASAHVTALGREVPLLVVGHPSTYATRDVWRDVVASLRDELVRLGVSPVGGGERDAVVRPTLALTAQAAGADTPNGPEPGHTPPADAAPRLPVRTSSNPGSQVRQSEVGPLRAVCALLGLEIEEPDAPYPGRGKVVRLAGDRRVYINAGHVDVKARAHEIAAWDADGLGNTRPDNALYLRVMLDSNGNPLTASRSR
ncbi:hypothetical protein QQX10_10695 [Demequina sp. SYSU T00039]|uniref:Uracil DNA glycosylase superfamily protein n=1 Tax=Demequina lignilytica TaxID=3051663 RepID=A0AAW7M522_9MICO|nr:MULTISPECIES: hypothetical protein [unclassified Demequina]MDN4478657.1 hypothetical protein [Demequina sp. SYSU T00039-1]MDN4488635.1 hypothetical protein [Demequina sp. SYSU T00039]